MKPSHANVKTGARPGGEPDADLPDPDSPEGQPRGGLDQGVEVGGIELQVPPRRLASQEP